MITAIAKTQCTDFDQWLTGFAKHGTQRAKFGCTGCQVYRGLENANELTIVFNWSSAKDMQAFMTDPSVQQEIAKAGTIGAPVVSVTSHFCSFSS